MLSIAGGKLTTHRRIAQRVVDTICRELGRPVQESPTLTTPLPGARPNPRPAADAAADTNRCADGTGLALRLPRYTNRRP